MIKICTSVRIDDLTPNRATITAVGHGHELIYHCPVHGKPPAVGDRIWLGTLAHRPKCCPHTDTAEVQL